MIFLRHNNVESATTSHRPFGPKTTDHPTYLEDCPACGLPFVEGDITTLVPLGPGDNAEAREKASNRQWYNAVAIECHWSCVTGRPQKEGQDMIAEAHRAQMTRMAAGGA